MRTYYFIILSLCLSACGRSPDSQFYLLNPISIQHKQMKNYSRLSIGINEIHSPAYMSKPQVMIRYVPPQIKLEEFHRWVENLDRNTKLVIEANLKTLLPGAVILSSPWDPGLKPTYQLQIDILQFTVDFSGNSFLSADYLIYANDHLYRKGTLCYYQKVLQPSLDRLVISMNVNLNRFSRDLARIISTLAGRPQVPKP